MQRPTSISKAKKQANKERMKYKEWRAKKREVAGLSNNGKEAETEGHK